MEKASKQTIARTIVLFLALVNQLLASTGKAPLDIAENDVYQVASLIMTIGSTVISWWKNNSFTKKAIAADKTLQQLREDEQNYG